MKRVCAWCNKPMPLTKGSKNSGPCLVTHSICNECADNLEFQLGVNLDRYLETFKFPVVALDSNGALIGINSSAKKEYKDKVVLEDAAWGSKIYECSHSRLPLGCKEAIHCSGCAIRIAINQTTESNTNNQAVPAQLNQCCGDKNAQPELLVSADRVGNTIFLRITLL